MTISPLTFAWLALNLVTLALTVAALIEARADREAVRALNGRARELVAAGQVRRETFRTAVQGLLLAAVFPSLLARPELGIIAIGALMTVPVLLLIASLTDARDRRRMTVFTAAQVLADDASALARIEAKVDAGSEVAHQAFEVANTINEKLAGQADALIQQGEDRARRISEEGV